MYQVEITTEADVVSVIVNAMDENEAISVGIGMFQAGQVDTMGTTIINIVAYLGC